MWQPDVTVAAVCERDGKFLLVEERSKSTGEIVLNQPAGHLEDRESILQAVVRETLEETCRHFTPRALLGLYRLRTEHGKTYIRYTFCGEVSEIDPAISRDSDIIATHWLSIEELRLRNNLRSHLVLQCLQDHQAGVRYPIELLRELDQA
ncbi:MAG: NUDIX hydrolase [Pseudomonadota bacterium]